jgi:hypothetical protein
MPQLALLAWLLPAAALPVIDIMILPHSHQDAGFIVTYSHVRDLVSDRCYETVFVRIHPPQRRDCFGVPPCE